MALRRIVTFSTVVARVTARKALGQVVKLTVDDVYLFLISFYLSPRQNYIYAPSNSTHCYALLTREQENLGWFHHVPSNRISDV